MARPTLVKLPGLRRERIRALLTQNQLAARAGVTAETISHLENGSDCYLRTATWIARALNVDPEILTRKAPDGEEVPPGA